MRAFARTSESRSSRAIADTYAIVLAGIVGLIFGSFATVAAHRIPRRENIVSGRSKCPHCGHTITWVENIPVFSYLLQRGKCRKCGSRISPRYPFIELTTGVLFALAVWKFDVTVTAVVFAGFFWALVVLTAIDLEHKLLPDRVVYPATVVGALALLILSTADGEFGRSSGTVWFALGFVVLLLVILYWPTPETPGDVSVEVSESSSEIPPTTISEHPSEEEAPAKKAELPPIRWYEVLFLLVLVGLWIALMVVSIQTGPYERVAGAVIGAGVFAGFFALLSLAYPQGMGGGDVKLSLLLGAMLGYLKAPAVVLSGMFLSFVAGGVVSIGLIIARRAGRKTQIPFGPFLAVGTVVAVFVGRAISDWYGGRH